MDRIAQIDATQRAYTLPEYVARGAMGGAAASLLLLPAVSFLARRMSPQPAGLPARLQMVSRRLSGTDCITPIYENRPAFVEHVLVAAAWGALYGLARGLTHLPTVPTGPAYGLALTQLDERLLPPQLRVFPLQGSEFALPAKFRVAAHLLFGATLGLAFDLTRFVIPGHASASAFQDETASGQTSRYLPSDAARASATASPIAAYAPAPSRASEYGSPGAPTTGREEGLTTTRSESPSATPLRSTGIAAGPLGGTTPSGTMETPTRTSVTGSELLGKKVFDREEHAIGDVCKIEQSYVEVATPIVDLGPTLYVPYRAFSYCKPQGCFLNVTVPELAGSGWNTVPPAVLRADEHPGLSGSTYPATNGPGVEIPYYPGEKARPYPPPAS